jgi:hypothetical protein
MTHDGEDYLRVDRLNRILVGSTGLVSPNSRQQPPPPKRT